jgi:hypothetical protein
MQNSGIRITNAAIFEHLEIFGGIYCKRRTKIVEPLFCVAFHGRRHQFFRRVDIRVWAIAEYCSSGLQAVFDEGGL